MKKTFAVAVGLAAAMAAAVAMAQPGGGMGWGMGMGPGCGSSQVDCPGPGGGYGPGYGRGWGGGGGSALLTPEERTAFHDAMHAVRTFDECNAVTAQHRQLLEQRAKEKGLAAPPGPRGNMCERMKARGFIS